MVLEKTLESLLDSKEIKPVNPKGNQQWLFIGRTDAKAEVPILWPPDAKSILIVKDPDAGKDWRQEEKWVAGYKMVRQHNCLSGYKYEQTPGNSGGAWHATVHEVTKNGHDLETNQQQWFHLYTLCKWKWYSSQAKIYFIHHIFPVTEVVITSSYWKEKSPCSVNSVFDLWT